MVSGVGDSVTSAMAAISGSNERQSPRLKPFLGHLTRPSNGFLFVACCPAPRLSQPAWRSRAFVNCAVVVLGAAIKRSQVNSQRDFSANRCRQFRSRLDPVFDNRIGLELYNSRSINDLQLSPKRESFRRGLGTGSSFFTYETGSPAS